MQPYLHKDREAFEELVALVATDKHLPTDAVLRDYYITLMLDNLSQSIYRDVCVFRGGTSLSKCYPGTIERFSEDIDLTYLDTEGKSNKSISKELKRIESVIGQGFEMEAIDTERSDLSKSIKIWDADEDESTFIKLEVGARIHPMPIVEKQIYSYIHEYLLQEELDDVISQYYFPIVSLKVLDVSRTFLDKVYAVKTHALLGNLNMKVRHLYDVVQLFKLAEIQYFLEDKETLTLVVSYTIDASKFYLQKRDHVGMESLGGPYAFSDWKAMCDTPPVRNAYESLHEDLLYTDTKQSLSEALDVLSQMDAILSEISQ